MSERILVIGNGGFGTALALILDANGAQVTVWGHDADYLAKTIAKRENLKFLPGVPIPASIRFEASPAKAALGATLVVSAVPTRYLRAVLESFRGALPKRIPIVSVTKGIERQTLLRPSQVLRELHPGHPVAILSGPSHAEEIARRVPTSVVVAARTPALARRLQRVFNTDRFRVYANGDVIGVELGAALKNVIAIAAGVIDGLGFGDNTKATLITRGLVEISRLATRLGARKQTFAGLAGLGDLVTTSISRHGRNRAVGERIGRGEKIKDILASMDMVAEGVTTVESVMTLARRERVEMPIAAEVYAMLFEGKDPQAAVQALMTRSSKAEIW